MMAVTLILRSVLGISKSHRTASNGNISKVRLSRRPAEEELRTGVYWLLS